MDWVGRLLVALVLVSALSMAVGMAMGRWLAWSERRSTPPPEDPDWKKPTTWKELRNWWGE
jgi:hypothetical protein